MTIDKDMFDTLKDLDKVGLAKGVVDELGITTVKCVMMKYYNCQTADELSDVIYSKYAKKEIDPLMEAIAKRVSALIMEEIRK